MKLRNILAWSVGVSLVVLGIGAVLLLRFFGVILVELDSEPPVLPSHLGSPAVLVFSKANGFVHTDALAAVETLLMELGRRNAWSVFVTDNGAVMNAEQLARFNVVVGNNNSGTVLDAAQRKAFRHWVHNGGGYLGIHGAGGDPYYDWDWYVEELIGAQFTGHTMLPQFQNAVLENTDPGNPLTAHMPPRWLVEEEEWYAFSSNPRELGYTILLSLDETSYDPNRAGMDGEHPIAWSHDQGEGRAIYTAIGHNAATYGVPEYVEFIDRALRWSGRMARAAEPTPALLR